jgi:spore coat polysaccharide biosynthesis protein SpsF
MKKPNIGIITQARIGSSRLPMKTLLEINGVPLIEFHFRRLLESALPVYLATTTEAESDKLIQIADRYSIKSKKGSTDDVLSRFYLCAKENQLDVIVRVTSDCPLVSGEIIKKGVQEYLTFSDFEETYYSNTQNRHFPRGLDFEVFSFKLLEEAYLNCLDMKLREHVTPYMYSSHNPNIKIKTMNHAAADMSSWRLCVDTSEDFELLKKLISELHLHEKNYSDLVAVLNAHENLKEINKQVKQKELIG